MYRCFCVLACTRVCSRLHFSVANLFTGYLCLLKCFFLSRFLLPYSVADPGSGAFLTLGSGIDIKSGSGSGMNNPDHISESLETIFGVIMLIFFDPGSGM
jgi:hypothetical protein